MTFLRRRSGPPLAASSGAPLVPTYHDVPLRLLVLFDRLPSFDGNRLRHAIHDVDPQLPDIRAEIVTEALEGTTHGLAGWGADEVIHVDGSSKPVEPSVVDALLSRAELETRAKDRARATQGHIVLTYVGRTEAAEIRFLALEVVAAALSSFEGAALVGNRVGRNAMAAADLRHAAASGLAGLRALPRLALACGFDTFVVSGWRGTWSRTYGAGRFGLPDLARHSTEPETREHLRTLFTAVHDYLRASGATIRAGDHLDAGAARLVARDPRRGEPWLESDDPVVVLEDRVGDG